MTSAEELVETTDLRSCWRFDKFSDRSILKQLHSSKFLQEKRLRFKSPKPQRRLPLFALILLVFIAAGAGSMIAISCARRYRTTTLRRVGAAIWGSGFYTTTSEEQAANFARKVYERTLRHGATNGGRYVSRYTVDYEVTERELALLRFTSASDTWLDFVMANRMNSYTGKKYDTVYGPVANDTIYRTLIAFEVGALTKKQVIRQLKARKLHDQITFKTEKALSYITYMGFLKFSNE
jgi:hypothetical protein